MISVAATVSCSALAAALAAQFAGALDLVDRLFDIERFRQIFERAAVIGRYRAVEIGVRGHDDDRQIRVVLLDLFEQ